MLKSLEFSEIKLEIKIIKHVIIKILSAIAIVLLFITACSDNSTSPNNNHQTQADSIGADADPEIIELLPITSRSFRMGTAGFVPRNHPNSSSEDWQYFFDEGVSLYGGIFGVHVNPSTDLNNEGIPNQVVIAYEDVKNVEPYIALGINHEHGPFTEQKGEELRNAAVAIVKKYKPEVLSLGVESNSLYLFQQDTYDLYVQYVHEIYDSVKELNPNTLVMNNFQLDRMKGETALTGENFEPHWQLINQLDGKIDLISFTVYPFLNYKTIDEIPDDYLSEILHHTDLPIIMTETGWPTVDLVSGVTGSDSMQINYMLRLIEMANELDAQIINWVLPHDAEFGIAGGIFDHISLFKNNGTAKPAYEYWKAVNALPLN